MGSKEGEEAERLRRGWGWMGWQSVAEHTACAAALAACSEAHTANRPNLRPPAMYAAGVHHRQGRDRLLPRRQDPQRGR